ncbi:Stp1/IreP family PP2C-type Ser/Thr phosphatase [Chloroflexota bacterium]
MTRSSNQDAYCAILAPNAPSGVDALLAVADGMGGHQAGEVASTMAIQGLVQRLSNQGPGEESPTPGDRHAALLSEVIQQVNAEVHQAASQPETRGMGSTLTVALLAGSSLAIGHVGDSRAYLLRNGQLQQLTRDHSWVAEEVARGALTPEEARTHRRRNLVTRAIGTSPQITVDVIALDMEVGDTLLLCSDGLHSLVVDEEIAGILTEQSPSSAAQTLVDRANALGGKDNITVVIARVERLGNGATTASGRRDIDKAKTVATPGRKGVPKVDGGGLVLRIVLLPFRVLIWMLRVLGRTSWATLRFFFGRQR